MADTPRSLAATAVAQVLGDGRSLSAVLPPLQGRLADPRARALLQELAYGTLRWQPRLAVLLGRLLREPLKPRDGDIHALLLVGLYQLGYLELPPHAAVHETVEAARALGKPWAVKLVNGVLRAFQRRGAELEAALSADPVARFAHPAWLLERLQADWPDAWEAVATANNTHPPMSLRVNLGRESRDAYRERLAAAGLAAEPLPHAPAGLRLLQPCPVEALPGFADGLVSVQDGAAQLAADLLDARPGMRVLDACAAPGGKTAHILERTPDLAGLTAVDMDPGRLARVADTLGRLGLAADLVAGDAAEPQTWWDGRPYDRILLDAPCSATGVIRRHPDIKVLRQPGDIAALARRQHRLLAELWPLLAPGGMLLYITCSVLREENSRQVAQFLAARPAAQEQPLAVSWGRADGHGRQILPGDDGMDGFYFAVLAKGLEG